MRLAPSRLASSLTLVLLAAAAGVLAPGCKNDSTDEVIVASGPGGFQLVSPGNGETNVSTIAAFTWSAEPAATSYTLQVSPTQAFAIFLVNQAGITGLSQRPSPGLPPGVTLWWRVQAVTPGGVVTAPNAPRSFTTRILEGEIVSIPGTLRELVFDTTRNRVYVTNESSHRVEVYDVASNMTLTPIPVGVQPWGLDLTPDNSRLLVCLTGESRLAVVDLTTPAPAVSYVNIPTDSFGTNRARTIAVAANGRAFFTCVNTATTPAPGNQTRVRQLNLADLVITERTDMSPPVGQAAGSGFTRDVTAIAASGDRSVLVFGFLNDFFLYSAATDTFTTPNRQFDPTMTLASSAVPAGGGVAANADGTLFALLTTGTNPGPGIVPPDRILRAVINPEPARGFAFAPAGNRGYRAIQSQNRLGIVDLLTYVEVDRIQTPMEFSGPLVLNGPGSLAVGIAPLGLLVVPVTRNRPPVIEPISTLSVNTGESVSVTLQIRDLEGDAITLTAPGLPAGATFNPATRVLTYTPGAAGNGTIIASDAIGSSSMTVAFAPVNVAQSFAHRIPVFGDPRDLVVDPVDNRVYVSNAARNRIEVFDIATRTLLNPIPVGSTPVGIDISEGPLRQLVVCTNGSEFIQLIDLPPNPPTITSIQVTGGNVPHRRPFDTAVAANGRALFSSNYPGAGNTNIWELTIATTGITVRTGTSAAAGIPGGDAVAKPAYLRASGDRAQVLMATTSGLLNRYTSAGATMSPRKATGVTLGLQGGMAADATGDQFALFVPLTVVDSSHLLRSTMAGTTTGFVFAGAGNRAYRALSAATTIQFVDTERWVDLDSITIPAAVTGTMGLNAAGTRLFAICQGPIAGVGGFLMVRTDTNRAPVWEPAGTLRVSRGEIAGRVVQAIDVNSPVLTYSVVGAPPAFVTFTPATRLLTASPLAATATGTYNVTLQVSDGTLVVNQTFPIQVVAVTASTRPIRFLPIAGEVRAFAQDTVSNRLFLTNFTRNRVEVIDLNLNRRLDPIPVLSGPVGLDVTAGGTRLLVCSSNSSFVQVFDITTAPALEALVVPTPDLATGWARPLTIAAGAAEQALVGLVVSGQQLRKLNLLATPITSSAQGVAADTILSPMEMIAATDRGFIIIREQNGANTRVRLFDALADAYSGVPLTIAALTSTRTDAIFDGANTFYLMGSTAGARLLNNTPAVIGTGVTANVQGVAFRPGTATGFRHTATAVIEVMNLTATLPVASNFSIPEAASGAMRTDLSGTVLYVVTGAAPNQSIGIISP